MTANSKVTRVPLLWILIPFAGGICYSRYANSPNLVLLFTITFAGIIVSGFSITRGKSAYRWPILFIASTFLLGMARFETQHLSATKPPPTLAREATLGLKIKTLFNATDPDTALGIASVVEAPIHQENLLGKRIFFFLETKPLKSYPVEGETFQTIGVVRPLPNEGDGDRFDAYLRNLGINTIYKQGEFIEFRSTATGVQNLSNQLKNHLSQILSLNRIPDSPTTGAYKGLMLGEKSELTPEQKQLFLANGTMHLFAISGLHIGVIALCFHHLLGVLRLRGGYRAIAALLGICLFVIATGGSPSSWRATLMIACLYLVNTTQRQPSPLNALILSAIVYLLLMPHQLFQAGFQMSYLTVASILMLGLPLARSLNTITPLFSNIPIALQSPIQKVILNAKKWTMDTLGVSTAAFLISALLGMYYFQILPSYGILINMIALPIASLAIIAGFLALLFSPLNAIVPVSYLFNNAALVLIHSIQSGLVKTSTFPGSSIHTSAISATIAGFAILSSITIIAISYCMRDRLRQFAWQAASIAAPILWILLLLRY